MCTWEDAPRLHAKPVTHYRRNVSALRVGGLEEAAEKELLCIIHKTHPE